MTDSPINPNRDEYPSLENVERFPTGWRFGCGNA
jgi:hypothetical protein